MKKKFIFGNSYLNNLKQFWHNCPRRMCGQSLRKVGWGVLELLIGNQKVTDRPTDMCKAICLSSSKGRGEGQSNIHSGRSMLKCVFFSNNRYKQTCREVPMIYIKMCILLQHLQSHWQTLQLVIIELWAKAIHATWHVHVVSKQMYFVFKRRASEKLCFTP